MTSENHHKEIDAVTGVDTTGHEWDGIKELNNPLPRWWLIIFYASVVWSVVYWVLMPSWPGISGHFRGTRNHSERTNVDNAILALKEQRSVNAARLLNARSLQEIENDPELLQFAMAAGESAFGDNCATCHGVGGVGFVGYPNFNDDVWLWGGSLTEIRQTITHGIRAEDPQTRTSLMPAYGATGIFTSDQVKDMVQYVLHLSGQEANDAAVARATPLFKSQCVSCHGVDGKGDRTFGAPNLTDNEWLYGGDAESIRYTIHNARNGVMPSWNQRLDEEIIAALAIYVHTLGGGE